MALKTTVKVGSISNLSDARYCAGMGVDLLGFRVIAGMKNYISPEQFQEFRGWFAGPKVVAEAYGLIAVDDIHTIRQLYQPDYIEVSIAELTLIAELSFPIILSINFEDYRNHASSLQNLRTVIEYLILPVDTPLNQLEEVARQFPILLEVKQHFNPGMLELPARGIVLKGTEEDKPGLKNYGVLAEVLELLEEDN